MDNLNFKVKSAKCLGSALYDVEKKMGRTATPDEVELYLNQLKTDLKIGLEGFSSKIMLTGDKQAYSIMINIKEKNLRTELRDGDEALKEFAIKCGYKANVWQDVNLLLLGTYEALV